MSPGAQDTPRRRRLLCAALSALLIAATGLALAPGSAEAAPSTATDPVRIVVTAVTPYTPARSQVKQPLEFSLTVSNLTDTPLTGLVIKAQRGEPIVTENDLGASALAPTDPGAHVIDITTMKPVRVSVAADDSTTLIFSTTTNIPNDAGICLCADAVYPIFFTAHRTVGGKDTVLGGGSTYLPVSDSKLPRLQVGWVWPLIDRPHRLLSDNAVFEDDDLTAEVAQGGRLDKALAVIEDVGTDVPITLVVDPETIDELAVMAAGNYEVQSGTSAATPGTGSAAAAAWLERLHTVLTTDTDVSLDLTPYADPDVQSLTAHHNSWSSVLPSAMAARVQRALEGPTAGTDLAWPASGRITASTLAALVEHGTRSVVLTSASIRGADDPVAKRGGVARLKSGSTVVPALVTTSELSAQVDAAVTTESAGTLAIPRLLSDLSVRVTEDPTAQHGMVLTPPRYVDPDVTQAAATIRATADSTYTVAAPVSSLTSGTLLPTKQSSLVTSVPQSLGLPATTFDATRDLHRTTPTIRSLLTDADPKAATTTTPPTATALLASLPGATQRVKSAAFAGDNLASADIGASYARQVSTLVNQIRNGVHIVAPTTHNYTLASGNSALPVTVSNELDYPVTVRVTLSTIGGISGLTTDDQKLQRIAARSKVILHIPTTAERSGRIQVRAVLRAPDGAELGSPIQLSVHSTALGRIGVIIMIVAGALLVVALARRWYLSMTRRTRRLAPVDTSGDLGGTT